MQSQHHKRKSEITSLGIKVAEALEACKNAKGAFGRPRKAAVRCIIPCSTSIIMLALIGALVAGTGYTLIEDDALICFIERKKEKFIRVRFISSIERLKP